MCTQTASLSALCTCRSADPVVRREWVSVAKVLQHRPPLHALLDLLMWHVTRPLALKWRAFKWFTPESCVVFGLSPYHKLDQYTRTEPAGL